jgi:protein farnesyltransferase/geranylgeranyltransferase type-1 subunit alpha
VLEHGRLPLSSLKQFVEPYTEVREPGDPLAQPPVDQEPDDEVIDLDNPLPTKQSELPVPFAIEFLGDVAEEEEDRTKATEVRLCRFMFQPAYLLVDV